jgi:hypothetical protein
MKNQVPDYIIHLMQNILKVSKIQARFLPRLASYPDLRRDDLYHQAYH